MARPSKNNADFFGHDAGMRNHRKIKAIRAKFGLHGYAIWVMFLEVLTESDDNRFIDNDLELELLAGDFDVSVTETREVLDYCIRLELLFTDNGKIYSKTLDDKLKSVYEKRDLARRNYEKKIEERINSTKRKVSVTEMTQTKGKVNESKVRTKEEEDKEEKSSTTSLQDFDEGIEFNDGPEVENRKNLQAQIDEFNEKESAKAKGLNLAMLPEIFRNSESLWEEFFRKTKLSRPVFEEAIDDFVSLKKATDYIIKSEGDVKSNFIFWLPSWMDRYKAASSQPDPTKGKFQTSVENTRIAANEIRRLRALNQN